jgi:hypothetical protein
MTIDNGREEKVKGPEELKPSHEIAAEWPAQIVELAGSWSDDDFPTLEEIRAGEREGSPRWRALNSLRF